MAKSPRFAFSRFVITLEANVARVTAADRSPRLRFRSIWSDSKAGGKSLTHP